MDAYLPGSLSVIGFKMMRAPKVPTATRDQDNPRLTRHQYHNFHHIRLHFQRHRTF